MKGTRQPQLANSLADSPRFSVIAIAAPMPKASDCDTIWNEP